MYATPSGLDSQAIFSHFPTSFLLLPHYCGLGAGSIPFRAIANNKQCEMRGVIYVAGHPLLNRRCTRLPGCIRLRNDLYCVKWGVKLYSLILRAICLFVKGRGGYSPLCKGWFAVWRPRMIRGVIEWHALNYILPISAPASDKIMFLVHWITLCVGLIKIVLEPTVSYSSVLDRVAEWFYVSLFYSVRNCFFSLFNLFVFSFEEQRCP